MNKRTLKMGAKMRQWDLRDFLRLSFYLALTSVKLHFRPCLKRLRRCNIYRGSFGNPLIFSGR